MAPPGTLSSSVLLATIMTMFFIFSLLVIPVLLLDATPPNNNDLQTLLCVRQHLADPAGLLTTWKNDSLNFCAWSGVSCGKRHKSRVVALNLDSLELSGQIPACIANLTFLARIHLPNNNLTGSIPHELGQLNRLQYLNLSSNYLSGLIPDTLSSCSRLQIVDLGRNSLHGIPEGLGMLHNLSVLHLAADSLTGSIPLSLGCKSSLRSLVLTNNTLTGPIPLCLANSSSLQVLDLTHNHLGGEIPYALLNSRSLKTIALGLNNFVGSIPAVSHADSPLEKLILTSNYLSGAIPSSLGNLSSLTMLLLAYNSLEGSIPTSITKIRNLQALDLTYNLLSGSVPASLYNMSALTYLGIAANSFEGEIPRSIGFTLPSIEKMIFQGNQFDGQIPASLANATNLKVIDLQYNSLHGTIPLLGSLPSLLELTLEMNQLEAGDWSFLSSLANCTQLVKLSLSYNKIQGTLPNSIGGLPKSIEFLLLEANYISGTIPPEIGYLTNLVVLYMGKNQLTGSLPDTLGNLTNLFILSLSQNKLSGPIPLSISNLSQLNELYLQDNDFSGLIPGALGYCKNLALLNLSCNSLDGSIPEQLFTVSSLSGGLDLSHNRLSGQIPLDIGNLINLGLLNISNNNLSGQIPSTLGQCVHLESLHMEGNNLEGKIPGSFAELRAIIELDLSQNNLSGEIPELFESFSSLNLLNLSFNNLQGPVPTGGIFENTSAVYIQGNKNLCGSTPLLELPPCAAKASRQNHSSKILKVLGFSALSLLLVSFLAVILLKRRKKVKQEAHPSCKELKKYSYADVFKATDGFSSSNLVGSGNSGSVYKARFEFEEQTVAVKVFTLDQLGTPKSFLAECEALRNTRHRNLVRVITACSTFDPSGHQFKALILEYMPNGSLENWLYPKINNYGLKRLLNLDSRITIAMDIASALDYLHNHCMPPVAHCDLKPSNVLLDDQMGAHLADFGLAKFLYSPSHSCHHSSTSLLGPRGSIGYIAPEYGFGSKLSTEGDVYSYGVTILEMLTGKRPTDEMFTNGLNLHKFVVTNQGITFLAEQVSHHPPMGVAHCENEHFTYDITSKLKTKFLGNSVEIYPVGRTRVTLKKSGVVLDLVPPLTKVNNLIFGRTWVDSPGEMVMTNLTTGDKVVLYFQPCGWFGAGRYELDGYVYSAAEEPKIMITGKWNKSLSCQPCDQEGDPLPGTELKEIWRVAPTPQGDKYQYTHFAHKINSFDTAPKKLLASDSRLRPDRYALEKGDMSKSGAEKSRLEDQQRAEKRTREAKGEQFTPRWFNMTDVVAPTPWGDLEIYEYNGKYTEHRAAIDSSNVTDETDVTSIEFNPWQYGSSSSQ